MQKKIQWEEIGIVVLIAILIFFLGKILIGFFNSSNMSSNMKYPVNGKITSKFGHRTHPVTGIENGFHNGVDIAAPVGTPVYAPKPGVINTVYSNSTGGLQMTVDHDNGLRTGYAHLSESIAKPGQRVSQGEMIAKTGNTGATTGPHLHLTLRINGELVDPEEYFT